MSVAVCCTVVILAVVVFAVMLMQAKLRTAAYRAGFIAADTPRLAANPIITMLMDTNYLAAIYRTQRILRPRICPVAAPLTAVGKRRHAYHADHQNSYC